MAFKAPENSKKAVRLSGPWKHQKGALLGPWNSLISSVYGPWKLQKGPTKFKAPENAKKGLFKAPETTKKFQRFFMLQVQIPGSTQYSATRLRICSNI